MAVRERLAESLDAEPSALRGRHDLMLTRQGERVQVRGALQVDATLRCSACLEPADVMLDFAVDVGAVPEHDEPPALEGGEIPAEAVALYTYAGDTLNLTALVHDEVVMELPQRVLCRPDCQGLCSQCGANRNDAGQVCACSAPDPAGPFSALATLRPLVAAKKA